MKNDTVETNVKIDKIKNLTPRQRVFNALNHRPVDRNPFDLGGTLASSAHVSVVADVRQLLGLDKPGEPVKVIEPYQMLGEIAANLQHII